MGRAWLTDPLVPRVVVSPMTGPSTVEGSLPMTPGMFDGPLRMDEGNATLKTWHKWQRFRSGGLHQPTPIFRER